MSGYSYMFKFSTPLLPFKEKSLYDKYYYNTNIIFKTNK